MFKKETFILIIGAPGVGKGTYSRMLSKDLKLPELSTGDELRKLTGEQKEKIDRIMKEGKLVSDELILDLMKTRLAQYTNGAILDGFPRTYNQAVEFDKFKKLDLVMKLHMNEDILIKKLLGRRMCSSCGKGYNVCSIHENGYNMEPLLPKKSQNKCDDCDGNLILRADDNEKTIRSRLLVYEQQSLAVEQFYKNLMISLELKNGIKDYPILLEAVKNKLI